MIFYFSGTGNSLAAAKTLSEALHEPLTDIAQATKKQSFSCTLKKGERLGFVFPIYAWAPPKIVLEFVKQLSLRTEEVPYVFAVCTCGGSAGEGMELFQKTLRKKGLTLHSGFSVLMPDNYITGFDVESKEIQEKKLKNADILLSRIICMIEQEKKDFFRIKHGTPARLLTALNPMFYLVGTKTKFFYATEACIGCGKCQSVCTDDCIRLEHGKPVWTKKTCNMCLACLNRCPVSAIQYWKTTVNHGRYVHPCLR